MEITTTFRLEDEDPNWDTRIREAYCCVRAFDVLRNSSMKEVGLAGSKKAFPEQRAMNAFLHGGEFTEDSAKAIIAHVLAVAQLALNGRMYSTSPASATMRQAADRAILEVTEFWRWLMKEGILLENIRL